QVMVIGPDNIARHISERFRDKCGFDIQATVTDPTTGHTKKFDLFMGRGYSNPSEEKVYAGDTTICTASICTSLNGVKRNIYHALGCKTAGYALFVGDRASGYRSRAFSKGIARRYVDRTDRNKPTIPADLPFLPTTQMNIASASKVLTAL